MKSFPLSQSQLLIWTGQQINPDSPLYNMAFKFNLIGKIEIESFQAAFRQVVNESDAMRSKIVVEDGLPRVVFQDELTYRMEVLVLDAEKINDYLGDRIKHIFNLGQCLFDTVLIKHSEEHFTWFINQHHLITDGWAFALLFNKLIDVYEQRESNAAEPYAKYLESSVTKDIAKHQIHWQGIVDKSVSPRPFFTKSNDEVLSNSSRHSYILREDQVKRIEELLLKPGLRTWSSDLGKFNFFLTVLSITIFRLNKQRSINIGVPALNRITKAQKNTIGLFIEMFPIHSEIEYQETYESLYKKVNLSANGFLKHAQSGVSTAQINKVFTVVLNFINAKFQKFDEIDMTSEWLHPGASDPGHHVRLQVTNFDDEGGLKLSFDFIEAVFNTMEKTRFMEIFLLEVQNFIENSQELIYADEEKEQQLINSVNETDEDFPTDLTVLDLFRDTVEEKGSNVAVTFESESITYKELDERSNQLAHFLKEQHISQGQSVGILMDRSIEMMIGLIGIIKSGGAYVPLDPLYPQERIDYMIEDAEITVVVDLKMVEESAAFSTDAIINSPSPSDLIYTIYTSGSTGRPKGVMNEHGGVLNRLCWAKKEFEITEDDVILQKTNYTFDVSVGELFLPLITGCRLVMARPGGHRDSDYLKEVIHRESITSIHFVPPMLELFLLNVKEGECRSLKYVSCTGEVLKQSHVKSCKEKLPQVNIYNLYGPTEAAVEVTMWKSLREAPMPNKVTIGKPFSNVKIRIVGENDAELGILSPGELLIGGIQVARGYKNRPELTAEKFIGHGGLRWYRTGDLCQWLESGNIEFLGRMDTQVKIRGNRVELEEIEQVVKEISGIENCVVVVNDEQIIAYVKGEPEKEILEYLNSKLPEYMIPSRIHNVPRIPYLNNGKIDRRTLSSFHSTEIVLNGPSNEFQEFVHDIWAETLNLEQIDIHSNFFSEGGDSLRGIRVITHINAELDLELPVVLIFNKPSISELAVCIEAEIDKRMSEA